MIGRVSSPKHYGICAKSIPSHCHAGPIFGDCVFTLGMSCYETLLLRCVLHDINAQPCIFSRDIYSEWDNLAPDDFSLDLYAYYLAKKSMAKIVRWKVRQSERKNGVSTWNTGMSARWWLIRKTIAFSRKLKNEL